MTQVINSYELDGAPFIVLVTFPAGSPITSLVGGAAVAFAQGADGIVVPADSCTITGANTVAVQFGSDDLDEGVYSVQVRVTMPGNAPRTVADVVLTMKRSIGPRGEVIPDPGFDPTGVQLLFSRDGAYARAPLSAIDNT